MSTAAADPAGPLAYGRTAAARTWTKQAPSRPQPGRRAMLLPAPTALPVPISSTDPRGLSFGRGTTKAPTRAWISAFTLDFIENTPLHSLCAKFPQHDTCRGNLGQNEQSELMQHKTLDERKKPVMSTTFGMDQRAWVEQAVTRVRHYFVTAKLVILAAGLHGMGLRSMARPSFHFRKNGALIPRMQDE